MEKETSTKVTGCKTCKKGMNGTQKFIFVISIYTFLAATYGTIGFVKLIADLLK